MPVNLEKKSERIHVNVNNSFTWVVTLGMICFLLYASFMFPSFLHWYIFFYKKENKTKIKMTNLGPEKLQLPPTFLFLSVYSLTQIRRAFFSNSFFSFEIVSMLYSLTPTISFPAFSSQPSFLMRRKLAGLSNPHASSPNQLHGESPEA